MRVITKRWIDTLEKTLRELPKDELVTYAVAMGLFVHGRAGPTGGTVETRIPIPPHELTKLGGMEFLAGLTAMTKKVSDTVEQRLLRIRLEDN